MNRRSFLGIGSLIACGTALAPTSLLAAAPRTLRGGLPLRAADETILEFIRRYSAAARIIGASVLSRLRSTGFRTLHVLAQIATPEDVATALSNLPFSGVYAEGNTLYFTVGDVDAVVENLLPDAFLARLTALNKRGGNAFAHDALVYDPATNLLSDPFNARSGGLRLVNKTFGGVAALEVALRGTFESAQLNLPPSADFLAWRTRVLRQIAKSADAPKLAEKFLEHLAVLSDKLPAAAFQTLLRSRLVATALQQVFGVAVEDVISRFKEQRALVDGSVANSAIWLALLIAPEIHSNGTDGAALTWVRNGTPFQVARSRATLRQAEKIMKDYSSLAL